MNQVELWKVAGYEQVLYCENTEAELRAIIAVHNTRLGPSCGGVRMLPYPTKEEALEDVLRLAKGMSYKSSLSNIQFGGGKSVIIGDPGKKSKKMFHAFGELVNSLGGRYLAAKDMNIDSNDLSAIKEKTPHVLGIDKVPGSSGDPSPVTARGIYQAIRATQQALTGTPELKNTHVVLQGLGHVGMGVAEWLAKAGAQLSGTDTNPKAVQTAKEKFGVEIIDPNNIYAVPCDIFSPCARGAILNQQTIPQLKCRAVVGGANNQLETPEDGIRLYERGILYAPDYAVNAGGIINIFVELSGYSAQRAFNKADEIFNTLSLIFSRAKAEKVPPFTIADRMAEERLYGKRQ